MKNNLPAKWLTYLEKLDIAFQPILNINTGKPFAVEALLRNYKEIGFETIFSVFDKACEENLLYSFDIMLREKAIKKFTTIQDYKNLKLFYNLDNRLLSMPDFSNGNTEKMLEQNNVLKENICFEISERQEISKNCNLEKIIAHYKEEKICIAIDDFGVGFSGYKLLYDSTPNIIKIDRFFIQDIQKYNKKKIMFKSISNLAIQLGIKVIAEGVETKEEFLTCKDIGCHFIQGYLVQKPTTDVNEIISEYKNIVDIINSNKRLKSDNSNIKSYVKRIEPLSINDKMNAVMEYFKNFKSNEVIPIVNEQNVPVGILEERQIKDYIYSPYGRSILINKNNKSKLKNLVKECASTDIDSSFSTIIELYSNNPESLGVIITKKNSYFGFLSSRAIIEIMHEKNLLFAREQNPLTKLPGNIMIDEYMGEVIMQQARFILCYFDLDNFKAFNDVYGFRNGDRVIQLFADTLKKNLPAEFFKAHIGGDDFFCGIKDAASPNIYDRMEDIKNVIQRFTNSVREFYSQEDKENGYILSKDRDGTPKKFPLLTVSASIIIVEKNNKNKSINTIQSILSKQKKVAKNEYGHISISSLL